MSRHIERAMHKRDRAIVALNDLFSSAKLVGYTAGQLRSDVAAIIVKHLAKSPVWVRSYFDGYYAALYRELYSAYLVHGGWYHGKWYSTVSSRADYYGKHGIAAPNWIPVNAGFYWRPELVRADDGDPRPFYTLETERGDARAVVNMPITVSPDGTVKVGESQS